MLEIKYWEKEEEACLRAGRFPRPASIACQGGWAGRQGDSPAEPHGMKTCPPAEVFRPQASLPGRSVPNRRNAVLRAHSHTPHLLDITCLDRLSRDRIQTYPNRK